MRTAKTLIKLGGCQGWSESSLGAQSLCWFWHVAAHIGFGQLCPCRSIWSITLTYVQQFRSVLVHHTNLCKETVDNVWSTTPSYAKKPVDRVWPTTSTYTKKMLTSFGQPQQLMQRQCWPVLVSNANLYKETIDEVWSATPTYAKKP